MMIKGIEILQDKNPMLRKVSRPITDVKKIDADLIRMMRKLQIKRRVFGLSAVQIGYPIRLIMFEYGAWFEFMVNPEILKKSDKVKTEYENCLSIGGGEYSYPVLRAKIVKVRGLSLSGMPTTVKAHDRLARILQHEIDHLDGKLISDYRE